MEQINAIEVRHVSKSFKVFLDKGHTIKEQIVSSRRRKYEKREVLKDISFSVKKGEAIGLIGHNGCGKSTTLKLLTRIMYPDSGTITMRGRVSSLIELGAGFHPDMSGRENIYINASIFGLNRKEIDRRLEDIIVFSELEDFIDNPVRTYSSGMYMRLAFSVAINVDADILLIDEILAVGDINFQEKCFARLREIKRMGVTIVIVSHSMAQIEQICDRSIWIQDGGIMEEGIPKYVHEHYLKSMEDARLERQEQERKAKLEKEAAQKAEEPEPAEAAEKTEEAPAGTAAEQAVPAEQEPLPSFCSPLSVRIGTREMEFTNVKLMNLRGEEQTVFQTGEPFQVQMDYRSRAEGLQGNFGIGIFRDDGVHVYGTNVLIEYDNPVQAKPEGRVTVTVEDNCLLPARYMLDVAVHSPDGVRYDDIRNIVPFTITARKKDIGVCRLESSWVVDGEKPAKREYNRD